MAERTDTSKETIWIELFAFGVAIGAPDTRPVLLLKDETEEQTLPVWLTHVDAALVVDEVNPQGLGLSPNALGKQLLESAGIKIEKCIFTDVVGHHQYVNLEISGHPKHKVLRYRADQAMSFCLHAKARFYCTADYIEECRDLNESLNGLESSQIVSEAVESTQRYLM